MKIIIYWIFFFLIWNNDPTLYFMFITLWVASVPVLNTMGLMHSCHEWIEISLLFFSSFFDHKILNRFHQFVLTLWKCVQHSVFRQWKIIKLISLSTLSSDILNWRKVWDTNNNDDIKMLSIRTALQMRHSHYHNFHLEWLLTVVTKNHWTFAERYWKCSVFMLNSKMDSSNEIDLQSTAQQMKKIQSQIYYEHIPNRSTRQLSNCFHHFT